MDDFEEIYDRFAADLYCVCLRAMSQRDAAEELAGEAFLRLHREREQVTDAKLPEWLYRVARMRATELLKSQNFDERWIWNQGLSLVEDGASGLALERVFVECASLKHIHRVCLALRFRHAMSRTQIAEQTGLSQLQVKGHLQQALRLVREFSGDEAADSDNAPRPESDTAETVEQSSPYA